MSENDLHQVASHTAHVNMNHAMSKTYSHINEHMLLQPSPQMRRISPHAFQVEGKQPSGPRETGVPAVVAAETTQKKKKRRTKAPWKTRYWSTTTRRKKTVCNVFIAHQFAQAYKCTRPKASATHTHTHARTHVRLRDTHPHPQAKLQKRISRSTPTDPSHATRAPTAKQITTPHTHPSYATTPHTLHNCTTTIHTQNALANQQHPHAPVGHDLQRV